MNNTTDNTRWLVAIWLIFTLVGMSVAYLMRAHATAPDGTIVPMSNDSFYHAERMLDTAGERGFYEFDDQMHVAEGSWVTWPWAYDWSAGHVLKIGQAISPESQPMAILGWIPVLFIAINMALFIGIAARLGLRPELIAMAALALAFSTALQTLHGFAILDHHFLEFFAYLACTWLLMRWLDAPERPPHAAVLGVLLGIAPALHTSAFILQLLMLITLALLWFRDELPPLSSLRAMAIGLVVGTLVIVGLSEPARDGQFTMTTLSLFHGYVAFASAAAALLLSWRPCSSKQLAIVAVLCALIGVPLIGGLIVGGSFLTGDILLLDQVNEMRSPVMDMLARDQWSTTFSIYSLLILLVPLVLLAFIVALWRRPSPAAVAFFVCGVFGLVMLSLQQRLIYFGIAPLLIGSVWLCAQATRAMPRSGTALITLIIIAIAIQPGLRGQIFKHYPLGLDRDYEMTYDIFRAAGALCAQEPGLIIASNNDGHPLRYHSDCSVLTNNFILTPQHEAKSLQLQRLLGLSPTAFLDAMPDDTRYLMIRLGGMFEFSGGQVAARPVAALRQINPPLFMALAEANTVPAGFELVAQLRVPDARDLPMVQIYRVTKPID